MEGDEELRIAGAVARRWARTYGLDVEEATAIAAAAIVEARPSWDAARGPWAPFAAIRGRSGLAVARRRQRAAKRGAPERLESDPESPACAPDRLLARDELAALLRARGATPRQAEAFAAWLGGETQRGIAARLGVWQQAVGKALRAVRSKLGLSADEGRALRGFMRGELLEELRWAIPSSRIGNAVRRRKRPSDRRARGVQPVDQSTVYLRQQRALAKLRGVA